MTETNELSEREQEILRLVATGASNKEIAQRLTISANTVKVHLRNIFAKIGAASRTEAAMYAVKAGLVPGAELQAEESNPLASQRRGRGAPRTSNRRSWCFQSYWAPCSWRRLAAGTMRLVNQNRPPTPAPTTLSRCGKSTHPCRRRAGGLQARSMKV